MGMLAMKYLRYVVLILSIISLQSIATTTGTTTSSTSAITTETIEQQLKAIPSQNLPENEAATEKANLEQALQFIKTRDDAIAKLAGLKKQIAEIPEQTINYRQQLEKLIAISPSPLKIDEKSTDTDLQTRLTENNTTIEGWQTELASDNNTIQKLQTLPEDAQAQINKLQVRNQEITDTLKTQQTQAATIRLEAEQASIKAQINLLTQELSSATIQQEHATSSRNLLTERINRLQQENTQLQTLINARRTEATEKIVQELAEHQDNQTNALLRQQSEINLKLSEYLAKSNARLNEITNLSQTIKQQLSTTQKIQETLTEQSIALKNSIFLSRILYQQKQALPTLTEDTNLINEIADLRLYQFQLNEQQSLFISPTTYVNKLLANNKIDDALREQLLELARIRQDLFSQLQHSLNSLTTGAVNLQLTYQQLQTKVSQISSEIDEKMFWLPSNSALDYTWLKHMPADLKAEVSSISWKETLDNIYASLLEKLWIFCPLIVLIIILVWKRNYLTNKIAAINNDVGNVKRDTQLHTPLAILFNILLALPVSLALASAGFSLSMDNQGINPAIGSALLELALGWLFFYTCYRLLSPNGVAIIHFKWDEEQVSALRKQIFQIGTLALILMAVVSIASNLIGNLSQDVLGMMTVIICYLLLTIILARTTFSQKARNYFNTFRWIIAIAIVLLPFSLMIATIAGYYYTSVRLTARLIDTLYTLMAWAVLEALLIRGLSVAARRIAFQRILEKRKNKAQSKEGEEEVVEEHVLDIQEINQQSLRLIRLSLFVACAFLLYWIWSDVLAVFSYLDSITLYQYVGVDGSTLVPLTLKVFIIAIIIAVLTVVLTRNIPGLLEVTILSRLNLERGISYAITTLLTYIIIAVGFSSTLGLLGVSWSKLQWLVAALSVGLGFGLQEIFKNFVSGIILLFERPVRIGDRITVGGVTGTVNRIQIRATHITDGERKEVIIPNTTFATGQIINWTLTDTITRITLKIGVDYDSDVDRVKQILLQIAQQNPRVIQDPGPTVSFINFGVDTLDFELTMLVNEIADRSLATDEINQQILTVFRKENINMPFHQIDVTLKNSDGKELLLPTSTTDKDR